MLLEQIAIIGILILGGALAVFLILRRRAAARTQVMPLPRTHFMVEEEAPVDPVTLAALEEDRLNTLRMAADEIEAEATRTGNSTLLDIQSMLDPEVVFRAEDERIAAHNAARRGRAPGRHRRSRKSRSAARG
ncbi:hypothetical protein LP419_00580 [Massilia sp. H-1]|nr:hypothetical protein LP419_00580 [Massilia sp. H-1]